MDCNRLFFSVWVATGCSSVSARLLVVPQCVGGNCLFLSECMVTACFQCVDGNWLFFSVRMVTGCSSVSVR